MKSSNLELEANWPKKSGADSSNLEFEKRRVQILTDQQIEVEVQGTKSTWYQIEAKVEKKKKESREMKVIYLVLILILFL